MIEKVKEIIALMNEKGIPLPAVRDKGVPSFTATMFCVSFAICVIALIGKMSSFFGTFNYNDCLTLYMASGSFYFGRKWVKDKNGAITSEIEEKKPEKPLDRPESL